MEKNKKSMDAIRARVDRKNYNKVTDSIPGFQNRRVFDRIKEKEDFRFALAFGMGGISLLFLGFLSGYCLGKYVLEWDEQSSLILCLVFGVCTLFLEGFMMIFRLQKWEQKREMEKKIYKVD